MGLEVEMKLKQEELKLKQEETPQTDSGMASEEEDLEVLSPDDDEAESVEMEIVWGNVAKFVVLHALALYSVVLLPSISLASWVFLLTTYIFSGMLQVLHLFFLLPLLMLLLMLLPLLLLMLLLCSCSYSCPCSCSCSCSCPCSCLCSCPCSMKSAY